VSALRSRGGPLPWTGSRGRSRQIGYYEAMGEIIALARFELKGMEPAQALAAVLDYADGAYFLGVMPAVTLRELDGPLGWGSPDQARVQPGGAR